MHQQFQRASNDVIAIPKRRKAIWSLGKNCYKINKELTDMVQIWCEGSQF